MSLTNFARSSYRAANGVRAFATAVESLEPKASTSAIPANDLHSDNTAAEHPPLPKTGAPTPYHPYVHVPLLSFAEKSSASSDPAIVPLPAPLFNVPSRPSLLHKLVIAHLSSLRAGTASTKNRSEVNYSGKKIRPQKGTGRARLGSRGSPMLTGGGRAFGPRPKGPDGWTRKINRKEERLGLRITLSEKWRAGNLKIVDRLSLDQISTRELKIKLASRDWLNACFIMSSQHLKQDETRQAFQLASGNLTQVGLVTDLGEIGVWDILKREKVVLELDAVDELIFRLDPENELGQLDEEVGEVDAEEEASLAEELETALSEFDLNSQKLGPQPSQ